MPVEFQDYTTQLTEAIPCLGNARKLERNKTQRIVIKARSMFTVDCGLNQICTAILERFCTYLHILRSNVSLSSLCTHM